MGTVKATSDGEPVVLDRVGHLETLYRGEYNGMVRLAFTLVGDRDEAEEIVQDSLLEVFRRWDNIREPGAYLRCAVVSRCRTLLNRRRMIEQHPPAPPGMSPEAGDMWDVLAKLSDEQRVAVVLRYYGGYRAAEIADIAGIPAATVRSHLRRGLAALKKELV